MAVYLMARAGGYNTWKWATVGPVWWDKIGPEPRFFLEAWRRLAHRVDL